MRLHISASEFLDAPFSIILSGHVWTVPGNMHPNLKSVALTVLELLAFNAQKFGGRVTLATPLFEKSFKGSCLDCPWVHARQT